MSVVPTSTQDREFCWFVQGCTLSTQSSVWHTAGTQECCLLGSWYFITQTLFWNFFFFPENFWSFFSKARKRSASFSVPSTLLHIFTLKIVNNLMREGNVNCFSLVISEIYFFKVFIEISLVIQWLRFHILKAEGSGFDPWSGESRSHTKVATKDPACCNEDPPQLNK